MKSGVLQTFTGLVFFIMTTGVFAQTQTMPAGLGANDAGYGTVAWNNPANIYTDNAVYAVTGSMGGMTSSNYLKATNFGFSIPAGAQIDGIEVSIDRKASGGSVSDDRLYLLNGSGSIAGNNKASATAWPTADAVAMYGGAADTWGAGLTVADINNPNFGIVLSAKVGFIFIGSRTASVDFVSITVYYSIPCICPGTQASGFTTNSVTATSMNMAFTRGNGDNVMVIARAGAAPGNPVNGTVYTANSNYGSGSAVGGGFCVYNGPANGAGAATGNLPVTGLSCVTNYYFAAFEYNNVDVCYNTIPLTGNQTTTCSAAPASPVSSAATGISPTSFVANWSASACASSYLLDVSENSGFSSFVSGYNGLNVGNVTSYNVTGLSSGTTYYYRVRAVNSCGTSGNSSTQTATTSVITATDARGSAPELILYGPPNTCNDIPNLKSGRVQVRNLGGSTLDNYIASESCFVITHSNSPAVYKNVWFKVTIPAGSGITGIYFYSSMAGVSPIPSGSANLRSGYLNVFTGTTTCTPQLVCGDKFENLITSYSSTSPYIEPLATQRVDVTPGTTYYVEVWTLSAATDPNFNFDIHVVPLGSAPANDDCTGATSYTNNQMGCNLGAQPSCNAYVPSCWFTLENSSFYYFTSTENPFQVTIDNVECVGGGNDMQASIFRATPGNCTTNLTSGNEVACHVFTGTYTFTVNNGDPPGTTYIIWFDGNAGANCKWNINVLPVELTSFGVSCDQNHAVIHWTTASELNNDYFKIERSQDGRNFETIAVIPGSGTTNYPSSYEFSDVHPHTGTSYYRLVQTDYDGKTTVYDMVAFNGHCENNQLQARLYPNPVFESDLKLEFLLAGDTEADIRIISTMGEVVSEVQTGIVLEKGFHQISIETDQLNSGMYCLILSANGENTYLPFVKK